MRNIFVDPDWFYHQIDPFSMYDILSEGAILSKRLQNFARTSSDCSWNGRDFISVAKYDDSLVYDSAYKKFILGQYAFVLQGLDAVPTVYCSSNYDFWRWYSNSIFSKRRFSCYRDEWQVQGFIEDNKIVGIKIPESDPMASIYYTDPAMGIDLFLSQLELVGRDLPFIDIRERLEIDKESVKQYIMDRR